MSNDIKTQRQEEILRVSFELIANKGVQEFTIKNLAEEIGISEPAIYRHFSSKREILERIADSLITMRDETWSESMQHGLSTKEIISRFFISQAKKIEFFPSFSIALYPEEVFRNDEELLKRVQNLIETTIKNMNELIKKGKQTKEIINTIEEETVSFMLIGGFRMLVSSWKRKPTSNKSLVKEVSVFVTNAVSMF